MESIQKFFYDLFFGSNWDKTYCEANTVQTVQTVKTNTEPTASNKKLAADLLPFMLKQLPS